MTDPTKECEAVRPLLREHVLGLLSEHEARRVDAHAAACAACSTRIAFVMGPTPPGTGVI